ncbi:hypothetical protein KI688_007898 [Linnemannia hyalina]|uniref:Secreted protein n=1 Tax=Linnemannia hyalina TaxID=64524 RepID=A0A9P8BM93_9FUNG|nr:hypothetical protein KI688_007898 [Linnemannia hyalina]
MHSPGPLLVLLLIATLNPVTAYWKTEFHPCKDSRTHVGVAVSYLYCDMYKFTKAGYKCNETTCVSPSVLCIKDGRDPVDQAKTYLRATGACQDLDRAKFEAIKGLDMVEDEGQKQHRYLFTERVRPRRPLFVVR